MALKVSDGTTNYTVAGPQMGRDANTQMPAHDIQDIATYCVNFPWLHVADPATGLDLLIPTSSIKKIWKDNT